MRHLVRRRIAVLGNTVKVQSAGVGQSHCSCRLVHRFACRIVMGVADNFKFCVILDFNNMAVTARNHKTEKFRLKLRAAYVVCGNVRTQVVDGNERNTACKRQTFCIVDADQKRTDKSRSVGHGNGRNVIKGTACVAESLVDNA